MDSTTEFWRGMQMKLRKGLPEKDCPSDVPGVLLRGFPPTKVSLLITRVGWTYLSNEQVNNFLPYSMRLLIPCHWPVVAETKFEAESIKPPVKRKVTTAKLAVGAETKFEAEPIKSPAKRKANLAAAAMKPKAKLPSKKRGVAVKPKPESNKRKSFG